MAKGQWCVIQCGGRAAQTQKGQWGIAGAVGKEKDNNGQYGLMGSSGHMGGQCWGPDRGTDARKHLRGLTHWIPIAMPVPTHPNALVSVSVPEFLCTFLSHHILLSCFPLPLILHTTVSEACRYVQASC